MKKLLLKEVFGRVASDNQKKKIAYFEGAFETNSNLPIGEYDKFYNRLY